MEIHRNYVLWPNYYVAADLLEGTNKWGAQDKYNDLEKKAFEDYVEQRIALVDLPNPDHDYLRHMILLMYANPLLNYYKAVENGN